MSYSREPRPEPYHFMLTVTLRDGSTKYYLADDPDTELHRKNFDALAVVAEPINQEEFN